MVILGFCGFFCFLFCLFAISRAAPSAYGGSQARGPIRAVAIGLHQSHSNARSKLRLQPTPQPTATPDPQPTEQGQEPNPQPHGSQSDPSTTEPWRELLFPSLFCFILFYFLFYFILFFFVFLLFLWAAPAAYGGSQARGRTAAPRRELLILFFGCTCGMQKFLGQGLNPCHSSDLSHSIDSARSLTC